MEIIENKKLKLPKWHSLEYEKRKDMYFISLFSQLLLNSEKLALI
jgi:hypothetical protein